MTRNQSEKELERLLQENLAPLKLERAKRLLANIHKSKDSKLALMRQKNIRLNDLLGRKEHEIKELKERLKELEKLKQ